MASSTSYRFLPARERFASFRGVWDELNRAQANQTVLDADFVEPLLEQFADGDTMLGVSSADPPTLALLERAKPGIWQTFQPSQAPLGLTLFGDPAQAVDDAQRLLRALPGYALTLAVMRQDPELSPLPRAVDDGANLEPIDYIDTPRLRIAGDFESYWSARSKNLRHNLARQRRRLTERGAQVELLVDRRADAVARCVETYGQLESAGWKGEEGSAVAADNAQGRFYRSMLEHFCRRAEAAVYQLVIDGDVLASDLCLERDGTMIILKTTYDHTLKGFSPGLLLHQSLLEALFAEGRVHTIEFYGRAVGWHYKLTGEVRKMFHLNVHRSAVVSSARRLVKQAVGRIGGDGTESD